MHQKLYEFLVHFEEPSGLPPEKRGGAHELINYLIPILQTQDVRPRPPPLGGVTIRCTLHYFVLGDRREKEAIQEGERKLQEATDKFMKQYFCFHY